MLCSRLELKTLWEIGLVSVWAMCGIDVAGGDAQLSRVHVCILADAYYEVKTRMLVLSNWFRT